MSTFDLSSDSGKDSPKVKTGAVGTANRVAGAKPAPSKGAPAPAEAPPAGNPETVEFYLGESANSFMPNLKDFKSVALMLGSLLVVALVVGFMLRTQGNATAPEALPISAASVQPTGLAKALTTATGPSDPAKALADTKTDAKSDAKTEDTVKNPSPPSAFSSRTVSAVAAAKVVAPVSAPDLPRSTRLNEPVRPAPAPPVAVQPAPAVQPQQQPVAVQPAPQQRPVFRPAAPIVSSGNSGGRISVGSGSTSVRPNDD